MLQNYTLAFFSFNQYDAKHTFAQAFCHSECETSQQVDIFQSTEKNCFHNKKHST